MSTSKEYKEYILETINEPYNITCKPMMGEYLLYYNDVLIGGIYDDRLLVKKTINNAKYKMSEEIPYDSAKPMYFISDVDNADIMKNIIIDTYNDLK